MGIGWFIIKTIVMYEGGIAVKENIERHKHFNDARAYCDEVRKPLLVVGMKRHPWEPPDGDVTIDIDPLVENIPGGVLSDVTDIPFNDKTFGAAYCPHILEHMESEDAVQAAVDECTRVADKAVFLCPSPYSIWGNFFCPAHNFRVWFDPGLDQIRIKENTLRTGLGNTSGGQYIPRKTVASSMITTGRPRVVKIGNAYIMEKN
jgi:hypothetical protein